MSTLKSPVIEQWMRNAAYEYLRSKAVISIDAWNAARSTLIDIIAKHAPAQPAELAEELAKVKRELAIELERATHYRDAWQVAQKELAELRGKAQPAEFPSIWKPVSQRPTKEDADALGSVQVTNKDGVWLYPWNRCHGDETHWCRTADLMARCPLPKMKTQEELDDEFVAECIANNETAPDNIHRAIAYGRKTANTEESK